MSSRQQTHGAGAVLGALLGTLLGTAMGSLVTAAFLHAHVEEQPGPVPMVSTGTSPMKMVSTGTSPMKRRGRATIATSPTKPAALVEMERVEAAALLQGAG